MAPATPPGPGSLSIQPVAVAQLPASPQHPLLIQSQSQAESEGLNLGEVWQAMRRRRRIALLVGSSVAAVFFGLTLWERAFSPVYQGGFQILISDPISTDTGGAAGGEAIETLARNRTNIDFPSLVETLRSPMVLDPLRRQLGSAGYLLSSAVITQSANSVLVVTLSGNKPEEVQKALESLSKAYLNFAIQQRQQQLNEGLKFLNEQEPMLQQTVNTLQSSLAKFRQKYNLLVPETEAGSIKSESDSLNAQLRQLDAERSRLSRLRQGVISGALTSSSFSTGAADGVTVSQANSDLLAQLQSVEQQLSLARATYLGSTPRVQSLSSLRNRLADQLRANQVEAIDTALMLNATQAQSALDQQRQLDLKFLKQPDLIKDYELIQQRLSVAQDNLVSFLNTRSTFQLERAQKAVPWSLISPPGVNWNPVGPNVGQGFLKAVLFGLIAGIAAAVARDRLDHVFRTSSEVRDLLNVPLLGHVPYLPFFKDVRDNGRFMIEELDRDSAKVDSIAGPTLVGSLTATQVYQRFAYKEAFRNLYTSLRFLNTDQKLLSVGLTSCTPNEGKSLVNVLLAKTVSEMGQRVLLIDVDMRKPQIHLRLGVNNLIGLSTLLTNDHRWQQALVPVPGYDNWWVIPAGIRPPDPTRLLSSSRMQELLAEIKDSAKFDLILFDTPPVIGLADTALLSQHMDGLILLVSLDRVDRDLPKDALARINSAGAPLLGIVTNAVKEETETTGPTIYERYGYSEVISSSDDGYQSPASTYPGRLRLALHEIQQRTLSFIRWING